MAVLNQDGEWMNRNGRFVNPKTINRVAKKRDAVVSKVMQKTMKLQSDMEKHKAWVRAEAEKYLAYVKKHAGVEDVVTKGNLTLSDYANLHAIEISVNDIIVFDERLNVAKGIIDKCLLKWTKKSNINLKAIVDQAFAVDKKTGVNKMMILKLLEIEIQDSDWKKAMNMIRESMSVSGTRQYLGFRKRANSEAKFTAINLNLSCM